MKRFAVIGFALVVMLGMIFFLGSNTDKIARALQGSKGLVLVAAAPIEGGSVVTKEKLRLREIQENERLAPGSLVEQGPIGKDAAGKPIATGSEIWATGRVAKSAIGDGQPLNGDVLVSSDDWRASRKAVVLKSVRRIEGGEALTTENTVAQQMDKGSYSQGAIQSDANDSGAAMVQRLAGAKTFKPLDPGQVIGWFDLMPPGYEPPKAGPTEVSVAPQPVGEAPRDQARPLDPSDVRLELPREELLKSLAVTPGVAQVFQEDYRYLPETSGMRVDVFVSRPPEASAARGFEEHVRKYKGLRFYYYVDSKDGDRYAWLLDDPSSASGDSRRLARELDRMRARDMKITVVPAGDVLPSLRGETALCHGDVCRRTAAPLSKAGSGSPGEQGSGSSGQGAQGSGGQAGSEPPPAPQGGTQGAPPQGGVPPAQGGVPPAQGGAVSGPPPAPGGTGTTVAPRPSRVGSDGVVFGFR